MAKRAAKPKTPDPALEALTFEQALARLESIVDRIEAGEVGLEAAIAEYEQGVNLLKRCRSILDHAEQRISELTPPSDDSAPRARAARAPAPPEPSADDDEPAPF